MQKSKNMIDTQKLVWAVSYEICSIYDNTGAANVLGGSFSEGDGVGDGMFFESCSYDSGYKVIVTNAFLSYSREKLYYLR